MTEENKNNSEAQRKSIRKTLGILTAIALLAPAVAQSVYSKDLDRAGTAMMSEISSTLETQFARTAWPMKDMERVFDVEDFAPRPGGKAIAVGLKLDSTARAELFNTCVQSNDGVRSEPTLVSKLTGEARPLNGNSLVTGALQSQCERLKPAVFELFARG